MGVRLLRSRLRGTIASGVATLALLAGAGTAPAAAAGGATHRDAGNCAGAPWMDRHKSPGERASLLLQRLTLDDKMLMLHTISDSAHARQVGPIADLCVPALLLTNGSAGVSSGGVVQYPATALRGIQSRGAIAEVKHFAANNQACNSGPARRST